MKNCTACRDEGVDESKGAPGGECAHTDFERRWGSPYPLRVSTETEAEQDKRRGWHWKTPK